MCLHMMNKTSIYDSTILHDVVVYIGPAVLWLCGHGYDFAVFSISVDNARHFHLSIHIAPGQGTSEG